MLVTMRLDATRQAVDAMMRVLGGLRLGSVSVSLAKPVRFGLDVELTDSNIIQRIASLAGVQAVDPSGKLPASEQFVPVTAPSPAEIIVQLPG